MEEGVEVVATRTRVRPLAVALNVVGLLLFIVPIAVFKSGLVHATPYVSVLLGSLVASTFCFLGAQIDAFKRLEERGTVRVAERRLAFDGTPRVEAGAVRDAIVYRNAGSRHGVRARTRWQTFYFDVESEALANRIVSALGLDARRATVGFRPRIGGWLALMAFTLGTVGMWQPALLGPTLVPLMTRVLPRLMLPRWVVGTDGVLVEKHLGLSKRFIPYAEMDRLEVDGAKVTITLADWTAFVIESEDDAKESRFPVVGANALKARIEEARAASGASRGAAVAGELARGGRDVATWLSALRQLGGARATFRDAAVPRDRLWSALEDGTQPAEVRVGAAVALQPALAASERVRLASVASTCAAPRLRVALEAVAEEDEERIAEAVGELARERVARRG